MKSDGTFEKLPKPKPGNKYIIKKNNYQKKKKILPSQKKARRRTDTGLDMNEENKTCLESYSKTR